MPCFTVLLSTFITLTLVMECSCRQHHRHGTIPGCSRCGPGQVVIRPCDPWRNRDTECGPCPKNTYSPHHSYSWRCYPCARCGQGLYVAHTCTPQRDTVCDSCHTFKGPHNHDFAARCGGTEELFTDGATGDPSADDSLVSGSDELNLAGANRRDQVPLREYEAEVVRHEHTTMVSSTSRTQVLSVLLLSAVGSFLIFTGLAAFVFARHRRTKKMHLGQLYSSVNTVEPVML